MSGALSITRSSLEDGWVSISVEGELDMATVGRLQQAIEEAFDEETNLVVDLSETDFMDSTGLKALVNAGRMFENAGRGFALAVRSGPVSRLVDLSGVGSTIRIVEQPDEAPRG